MDADERSFVEGREPPAPNEGAQCRSCEPPPLDQRLRREACDGLRVDGQRRAASALVLFMLLCGCPQRVAVAPAPAPPVIAPHDAGSSCSADIEARAPGAEPVKEAELDLDGDGLNDLVFRSSGDLHGNSKFFLYRVDGACAHFVGSVTAFIVNTPHCVTRPPKGTICRLSAMRRMMHDDYQETFYEAASGELVEAGAGQYIPTPPNQKPRR